MGGSRQRRSLSLLPAMPLDVLFEVRITLAATSQWLAMLTADYLRQVFSHLTPRDIINLSRTSRIFRDTLMTRSTTSVWKASREQFGAPECPSNMSEPQWAVLLFGNVCQVRISHDPSVSVVIALCSAELRHEKHTQGRLWPSASGLHQLQEGKVSLLFH